MSDTQRELNRGKTVVVGMSGGVDSSVAAVLLRDAGFRVIGLFMKNWEEKDETGACTAEKDYEDVARVCDKLDIPYYSVEFVREYRDNVFKRFLEEYQAGWTPNPDVLCNREIKFNAFFKKAMSLGADYLATGHYCQSVPDAAGRFQLVKGADPGKDQTYFLYTVGHETLAKVLFPVGALQKSEVRAIARDYGLATAAKKDSTGICFIGERNFREFLGRYVAGKPGEIRTLDGQVIGEHQGSAYYTLGQRKGLGLGGEGEAWFVVRKDPAANVVYVARGQSHPALYADELTAGELSWGAGAAPSSPLRCRAKARYRQTDQECTLEAGSDGTARVVFAVPQRALTPGQSVVFYAGDACLGGGMIHAVGPSYHDQGRKC